MFRVYDGSQTTPNYTQIVKLNLDDVEPTLAGPKLPHDRVSMKDMKTDWTTCLTAPVSSKGFGLA
jgi:aconitate hydratase